MNKKIQTLCIIHEQPRILLGMKKQGFGMGKWNGFGGKVEQGEDIESAMCRELQEEVGIMIENFKKIGILNFQNHNNPDFLEVHIYKGSGIIGEPAESDEMMPKWFHVDEIPFNDMWPDDKYWMPLFLSDKCFEGSFSFDENLNILDMNLVEI